MNFENWIIRYYKYCLCKVLTDGGIQSTKWNVNIKPDEFICPENFCFHWSEDKQKCDESLGKCYRCYPNDADCKDLYEPCEPEMEKHNLPWLYFIPNPNKLPVELREEYIIESTKLLGK